MLRRDGEHGHAFVARGDDPREEVRRSLPRVADDGGHLAARLVEPLGHVRTACLVPDRDQAHAVLLERREQRIDLRRRESEDEADPLVRETPREHLTPVRFGHGEALLSPLHTPIGPRAARGRIAGVQRGPGVCQ